MKIGCSEVTSPYFDHLCESRQPIWFASRIEDPWSLEPKSLRRSWGQQRVSRWYYKATVVTDKLSEQSLIWLCSMEKNQKEIWTVFSSPKNVLVVWLNLNNSICPKIAGFWFNTDINDTPIYVVQLWWCQNSGKNIPKCHLMRGYCETDEDSNTDGNIQDHKHNRSSKKAK